MNRTCKFSLGYLKRLNDLKFYRSYSENTQNNDVNKLRNIGILAHIDAGKTTTTERMLYYSGLIQRMGEVHHGNTVTDYMAQERERGITIKSAAVTFKWKKHQINLIDTPGHIDFTMEVEQTLNVLDGAVVILDGCAGVEAQTLTVWRQADRYKIPRIVYVNKMDRPKANFTMSCDSIKSKLHVDVIPVQLPVVNDSKFCGLIDVLTMEKLLWNTNNYSISKENLIENNDGKWWEIAKEARSKMVDKLSGYDDNLANLIIAANSLDDVKTSDIVTALRKLTIEQKVVPVLCGSSYKNVGIQPLMDSVILYLPMPDQVHKNYGYFENNLSARAFKVLHDKQKGSLVFFRIFSGTLNKGQKFYNVDKKITEQSGKLYVAYADDFSNMDAIQKGNIAVVTGLKHTTSGDLITVNASQYQKAKNQLLKDKKLNEEDVNLFGLRVKIPEPVFFCSIEPPSTSYQSALDQALSELQREDPSLRVTFNEETGQTIIAGMGELHLEIIKDRLLREYKIEADLGQLQILYREQPLSDKKATHVIETKIGNSKHFVNITLSLLPRENDIAIKDILLLDKSPEAASVIAKIFPKHLLAIRQGIESGLAHGPKIGTQVINSQVMLHNLEVGKGTSDTIIAAAATQCVQKLLKESGTEVLEPIMHLEIVLPEEYSTIVLADLSRRRTVIQAINVERNNKVILCETPLSELLGYATILRTLSSGTAVFTMEFLEYTKMSAVSEQKAIEAVRGF